MKHLRTICLLFFITPLSSYASVMPTIKECDATIQIIEIIEGNKSNFKVSKTNCAFLDTNSAYVSSSIHRPNALRTLQTNSFITGEVATSSSMGPNGAVTFAVFAYPTFNAPNHNFFTFSY